VTFSEELTAGRRSTRSNRPRSDYCRRLPDRSNAVVRSIPDGPRIISQCLGTDRCCRPILPLSVPLVFVVTSQLGGATSLRDEQSAVFGFVQRFSHSCAATTFTQNRLFTGQTAVARAVARGGERPHCARGEQAKRVSRLGRCVAAVLCGAVRWGPGGLNGRGEVGGAARALSERAQRVRISRTAPSSTQRAFGCRSGWQF